MRIAFDADNPGDRVAFNMVITDNAPKGVFYLVQRHEQSISRARCTGMTRASVGYVRRMTWVTVGGLAVRL